MGKKEEDNVKYDIDTMVGAAKKITLVGREYEVLPVKIKDMHYFIGEKNEDEHLFIPDKAAIDKGEMQWYMFGLNMEEPRKTILLKIMHEYVFYKEKPMTEELLNEHNWSFKEIGTFLYYWTQIVSE